MFSVIDKDKMTIEALIKILKIFLNLRLFEWSFIKLDILILSVATFKNAFIQNWLLTHAYRITNLVAKNFLSTYNVMTQMKYSLSLYFFLIM